jgi:hypothetical protein
MHALEVQPLPAEPAGTGGRVAAGPPGPGPAREPEVHDAARATTPSATIQIRLTTADLPLPPQPDRAAKPVPSAARRSRSTRHSQGRLRGKATPRVPTRALPQIMPMARASSRGRERPHRARPLARTRQLPGTGSNGPGRLGHSACTSTRARPTPVRTPNWPGCWPPEPTRPTSGSAETRAGTPVLGRHPPVEREPQTCLVRLRCPAAALLRPAAEGTADRAGSEVGGEARGQVRYDGGTAMPVIRVPARAWRRAGAGHRRGARRRRWRA